MLFDDQDMQYGQLSPSTISEPSGIWKSDLPKEGYRPTVDIVVTSVIDDLGRLTCYRVTGTNIGVRRREGLIMKARDFVPDKLTGIDSAAEYIARLLDRYKTDTGGVRNSSVGGRRLSAGELNLLCGFMPSLEIYDTSSSLAPVERPVRSSEGLVRLAQALD